jgi:hypothetical protein
MFLLKNDSQATSANNSNLDFDNELSWCIQKLSQMMEKEKNEKKCKNSM